MVTTNDNGTDSQFADLIAQNFDVEVPPAPAQHEPTAATRLASPAATRVVAQALGRTTGRGPRDWPASDEVIALEEAETYFTAPRPDKVMATRDPIRRLATIGIVAISLLGIVALIFNLAVGGLPTWVPVLGGVALVTSFGVLLWRLPEKSHHDDDDDGAVV
ncbi:MAG: hypothetical protein FWG25_11445 [Promicromonosporaceae bacterium]|nr:hypothetical protein [Promicromonosporaceae bacterium]